MKDCRSAKWIVGALLLLVVLVVGVLFLPPVQTLLARQILARQVGIDATLDQVAITPRQIEISNLVVQQGPVALHLPQLRVEGTWWRFLTSQGHVERIEATGWELAWDGDAETPLATSTSEPEPVAAAGWFALPLATVAAATSEDFDLNTVLAQWLLEPLPVTVGDIELEGRATWRKAGPGADGSADVRVSGQGPSLDGPQALQLTIAAVGARAREQGVESLDIVTDLRTELTTDGRLAVMELDAQLTAQLSAGTEQRVYGLALDLRQVEGQPQLDLALREESTDLFIAHLAADADARLQGDWTVALDSVQLEHLMLGRPVPDFSLHGAGQLDAASDLQDIMLGGEVNYEARDLSLVAPELASLGTLTGVLNFDLNQAAGDTRVTSLEATVIGAAPVARARLLQGIELGGENGELRVPSPREPVWEISFSGLPMSWVQPWVEPWVIDARAMQGTLLGSVTPQGLQVVTGAPLHWQDVFIAYGDETLVSGADLQMEWGGELAPEAWQVEVGRLVLAVNEQDHIVLQARGGQLQEDEGVSKILGRVEANLAGLADWPGLTRWLQVEQGTITADFGLGLGERLSLATAVSATGLQAEPEGAMLPQVEMDGRMDLLPDGVVELHLPGRVLQDERSTELTLNLRARPAAGDAWQVEGSVSGPTVHPLDLQAFTALLVNEETTTAQVDTGSLGYGLVQVNEPAAVWQGIAGNLQLNLGQVLLPDAPIIQQVVGRIDLAQDQIALTNLTADMAGQGSATAQGGVTFVPAERHYHAVLDAQLDDVAVDPWLRWLDPASPPVFTGKLDVEAQWQATARDLADLPDRGLLTAQVSSDGGQIRALGMEVERYVQTGQTVATLGAIFGALSGNDDLARQTQFLQSATSAAQTLSRVDFDQMGLQIERLASGDIVLSDINLIAPNLRLLGEGRITYRPGLAFWLQPLEINLSLSARDQLGVHLQQLGLVQAEADSLGYLPLIQSFTLDGSLAHIGTAELERLLMQAWR